MLLTYEDILRCTKRKPSKLEVYAFKNNRPATSILEARKLTAKKNTKSNS